VSLFSDIKFFIRRYLKNPILITAVGYIIYKVLTKYVKRESFIESIKIIEETEDYNIIYDSNVNKYILIYDKIYSSDSLDELKSKFKVGFKESIVVKKTGDYQADIIKGKNTNRNVSLKSGQKLKQISNITDGVWCWLENEETRVWLPKDSIEVV
jgi:hypothetical protein